MSEPDEFLASPFFPETLTLIEAGRPASGSPIVLPVAGDATFLGDLARYADERVAEAPAHIGGILAQLASFKLKDPMAPPELSLVLTEHEAYVDLKRGDFEATLFMFDANDASRSTYPGLGRAARAWAADKVDASTWNAHPFPASFVMHAFNLVTTARAARELVKSMKDCSGWRDSINRGNERALVQAWDG